MRSDQKSVNNSTTIGKEYASFIYAHLSKQTSLVAKMVINTFFSNEPHKDFIQEVVGFQ